MATSSLAKEHIKSLSGLGDLLGDILSRIEVLESQTGVAAGTKGSSFSGAPPPPPPLLGARSPSVANKLGVLTSSSQHGTWNHWRKGQH
jgi:hypothetical protein